MSSEKMTCSKSKLAWTTEARLQFLLRIVGQLQTKGQSIKWSEINMPGRTTKSLQHQWTIIKDIVASIEKGEGGEKVSKTGGKRKAKTNDQNQDQEPLTPEATPQKKRQRTRLPDSPHVKEELDSE